MKIWRFIKKGFEPLLIIVGIIFVSASSGIFQEQKFSLLNYWKHVVWVLNDLADPLHLVYMNPISEIERNLFPILLLALVSSAKIFFLALALAMIGSVLLLTLYFSVGKFFKRALNSFALVFGALPDIFIIAILQVFVIWYFKKFGILVIDIASVGENQVVLLPAIALSILPMFFFLSSMVSFLKEEEGLSYVDLAKSKGIGRFRILFVHMIRNILISLTYHGKQIIWMMLSNLLILEYLFNVLGITSFLFTYNTPSIFAVTAILMFIPLYTFLKCIQIFISSKVGKVMDL